MNHPLNDRARRTQSKWSFAFVLLGLLIATLAVWRLRPPASPSRDALPLDTVAVSRTNLILLAGRLCVAGHTNPFTGLMSEQAAEGSLRSRSSVSNGLLHGLSEGWHTNGQLQIAEHFQAGVAHGLRTKSYPNGVKLSEGEIVDGKFHGTFRRWDETGSLAEQVEFAEGQPHGLSLAYYPSGFLKTRVTMNQGNVLE